MSYMRASTSNPNGWRPGTVRLGEMRRRPAPDWKVAVANHAAAQHAYDQQQKSARTRAMAGMALVDARARGVRLPGRRLSGLGLTAIDPNGQLTVGAPYTFHFVVSGTVLGSIDPTTIASAVATDSNFGGPSAAGESSGFQVSFTYMGQGATVGSAANEMAGVINSHALNGIGAFANASFLVAEGGPIGQPLVSAANTNPVTTPGQTNQQNSANQSGSFSIANFLAGLGTGGVIALGVGAIVLLEVL